MCAQKVKGSSADPDLNPYTTSRPVSAKNASQATILQQTDQASVSPVPLAPLAKIAAFPPARLAPLAASILDQDRRSALNVLLAENAMTMATQRSALQGPILLRATATVLPAPKALISQIMVRSGA